MSRKRSRSILGSGFGPALGEKLADEVQAGQVRADELLQLRARETRAGYPALAGPR
jgi:hypothetical protein